MPSSKNRACPGELSSTVSSMSTMIAGGSFVNFPVCSSAAVHFLSFNARGRERRAERHACSAEARYSTELCTQAVAFSPSITAAVCAAAGAPAIANSRETLSGGK